MVVHLQSHYLEDWGRRITWAQEIEAAVSYDPATELQPRWQSKTLSLEKEEEKEKRLTGRAEMLVKVSPEASEPLESLLTFLLRLLSHPARHYSWMNLSHLSSYMINSLADHWPHLHLNFSETQPGRM